MSIIKNKGSWLSLLLALSLGSFIGLTAMEQSKPSSDDEPQEIRGLSEEEIEEADNFISLIIDSPEQARTLLAENPRFLNYLNYRSSEERSEATALALQHPKDFKFKISYDSSTPLLAAMGDSKESLDLMKELLDKGADINLAGNTHHIPVFFEAIRNDSYNPEPIIRFLANYDREIVNRPAGRFGQTPLQFAAAHARNENIIPLLLSLGADINAQDRDGWTALHYAVYRGNSDAVRTLYEHGANPNIKANDGRTADQVAADSPHYGALRAATLAAEARTLSTSLLGRLGAGLSSLWNWGSGS